MIIPILASAAAASAQTVPPAPGAPGSEPPSATPADAPQTDAPPPAPPQPAAPRDVAKSTPSQSAPPQVAAPPRADQTLARPSTAVAPSAIPVESIKIGAYFQPAAVIQGDTEFNNDDEDGFLFRNARLTGEARVPVNSFLASSFHFNFDVGTGIFLVKDVYGSLHLGEDWLVADVGQMKAPFLLAELTSEAELQFPTSPEGVRRIAYGRDRGVRLRGSFAPGGVHLGWAAAVQNGEGPTVAANTDSEFLYTGRFEFGPLGNTPLAEPDLNDSPFGVVLGGSGGYTKSTSRNTLGLGDVGAQEARLAGDLRLRFRGITLRAEYVRANVNPSDTRQSFGRYGAYAQAGYVLPLPWRTRFEVVARWEQTDLNDVETGLIATGGASGTDPESLGGAGAAREYAVPDNSEVRRTEVGVNTYLLEHRLKLQGSWVRTDYLEGPKTEGGGNPIVGDLFQLQLQFGWI